MSKLFVFGFLVALFSTPAVAQTVTGNTCVLLANTIAAGYTTTFSDRQFDALRYYANCSATNSASAGSVNVAYEAFSLGAKYDDAKRSEVCSKLYDSYNIKATDYNSAKVLFAHALPTIDKCLDAAAKGWLINYQQISPDSVSLNISHGGGLGDKFAPK